jgi:hypothetical protein
MISIKVVDTDMFLEMPMSARLLYYDLNVRADDDGFVGSPNKITKMIGASNDDLKILVAKHFIIPFQSGICVISDWKVHNTIKSDRYRPTQYLVEKSQLTLNDNKSYEIDGTMLEPEWNQSGTIMEPQVRLGKVRLGKVSINDMDAAETVLSSQPIILLTLNDKTEYPIYQKKVDEWSELYPAVDVMQDLRKMKGWIDANPTKRKTRRGILKFCNSWLSSTQDKGGNKSQQTLKGYENVRRLE